jgi:glycosyltransferase involved in cell wall biosynthesis
MNICFFFVIPTLNSCSLLPKLLLSLRRQDFDRWRVLFIDGESSLQHRQWLDDCCAADPRCRWQQQNPEEPGIFGAMNQGFECARPADWLLFWGSDDWAAAPSVLANLAATIESATSNGTPPDMLVCRGRYIDSTSGALSRPTVFHPAGLLGSGAFHRSLLLGSTPPHQGTLFGPGARQRLARYDPCFRLSADLDYFLQLSSYPGLRVQCLDLELVHMADGGVSGQQTQTRLQEVRKAYRRAFGWLWWLPFVLRYLRRLASLLQSHS